MTQLHPVFYIVFIFHALVVNPFWIHAEFTITEYWFEQDTSWNHHRNKCVWYYMHVYFRQWWIGYKESHVNIYQIWKQQTTRVSTLWFTIPLIRGIVQVRYMSWSYSMLSSHFCSRVFIILYSTPASPYMFNTIFPLFYKMTLCDHPRVPSLDILQTFRVILLGNQTK